MAPTQRPVRASAPRLAMLEAFHDPRYRLLWLAGLFVNAARWMDFLVLGWVTLELTDSPLLVAVAAFCRTAPMMVLGLFAGLLADRVPRGRLMILVQAINLFAALALALLFGAGWAGLPHLIVLEVLLGVAWALDFPSRRTVLYTLVGPGRLANAFSLESVSMQGTKLIGPLLGGVLLAGIGPVGCYVVLVAFFAFALLLIVALTRQVALPSTGVGETVLASLRSGLRDVRAQPVILSVLLITIIMNMLVFPYQQMLPVFARDVFGVGPERLGLLVAMDGLGALAGALAVAARHGMTAHRQVFAAGSLLAATLVIGLALSPWYLLSLPIQFLIGIAETGFGTMQSTIVLLAASDRARGRAMGILSVCIGTQPLGTLWIGFATSHVGAPVATALCAALGLLAMAPVALRMIAIPTARPVGASG